MSHYIFYFVNIHPFCVKILTDICPVVEVISLVDYEIHTCVCRECKIASVCTDQLDLRFEFNRVLSWLH